MRGLCSLRRDPLSPARCCWGAALSLSLSLAWECFINGLIPTAEGTELLEGGTLMEVVGFDSSS